MRTNRTRSRHEMDGLAALPLFGRLHTQEIRLAERLSTRVTLPAGTELCRQGQVGREAFVVVEGEAEVIRDDQTVARLSRGDVVGEMALLSRPQQRNATVRALTDVTVLAMSAREFESLLDLPEVGERIRALATERAVVAPA